MATSEVQKAVIKYINGEIMKCKSDEDYVKLATKLGGSKTSKKKILEKLGLEPEEEVKESPKPEATETPEETGGDEKDPDKD